MATSRVVDGYPGASRRLFPQPPGLKVSSSRLVSGDIFSQDILPSCLVIIRRHFALAFWNHTYKRRKRSCFKNNRKRAGSMVLWACGKRPKRMGRISPCFDRQQTSGLNWWSAHFETHSRCFCAFVLSELESNYFLIIVSLAKFTTKKSSTVYYKKNHSNNLFDEFHMYVQSFVYDLIF